MAGVNKHFTQGIMLKMAINTGMLVLMPVAFAYQFTGNFVHEIVGVCICALFISHNLLNGKWFGALFKGKYNLQRSVVGALNILLVATASVLAVSGVMISHDIFGFAGFDGGFGARQIHTLCAYWLGVRHCREVGYLPI